MAFKIEQSRHKLRKRHQKQPSLVQLCQSIHKKLIIEFFFANIIPMSKYQTAKDNQYQFSLAPIQAGLYYDKTTVNFKAAINLCKSSNSIVPAFLRDRCFYTPAFILPRQREYHESNKKFEKKIFEEKISKAEKICQDQKGLIDQQLLFDQIKPGTKYCQICQADFNSYFQHIKQSEHIKQCKKSPASEYISQLTNHYNRKNKSKACGYKRKQIKKGRQKKLAIKNKIFQLGIRVKLERDQLQPTKCISTTTCYTQVTILF